MSLRNSWTCWIRVTQLCDKALPATSIFAFLYAQREVLFPEGLFADLFAADGRRSVPPSVVATVMVLQRLEGLSDREAVERFIFDVRWRVPFQNCSYVV